MSRQAQQRARLALFQELYEIVGAMKNMAEVELHRATRNERNQEQTLATALEALALLLQAKAQPAPPAPQRSILVVLGSERGFCGGFNEQLIREMEQEQAAHDELLVIGSRLASKVDTSPRLHLFPGPSTAEEALPCAQQVLDHLLQLPLPLRVKLLCHTHHGIERRELLPLPPLPAVAPVIRLDLPSPPAVIVERLQWQCLHHGLLHALQVSLTMENRMRLQQMEGAREHLDSLIDNLRLRINSLRQQEIIEELEMILVDQENRSRHF